MLRGLAGHCYTRQVFMCESWRRNRCFLDTRVELQTTQEKLQGFVHAVDPETGNIILQTSESSVHIVFASAVRCIHSIDGLRGTPPYVFPSPIKQMQIGMNAEDIIKFLLSRHMDAQIVVKDNVKMISVFDGLAVIVPPYAPNCVQSTNEIVVNRVCALLEQASKDVSDQ